jgi:hypothetical protein
LNVNNPSESCCFESDPLLTGSRSPLRSKSDTIEVKGKERSTMATAITKSKMLEEAGYDYSFDRRLYINRRTKKAFSVEFAEDHNEDQLRTCIDEDTKAQGWRFYFNSAPTEAVKRELEMVLR